HRLGEGDLEFRMLLAGAFYFFIRFGFAYLFNQLTVHRGMCHSLPAALISGLTAYLVFGHMGQRGALAMAGGVSLGYLSHLILDEIYAVDFKGLQPKLNQFAGSAIKLASKSSSATLVCWLLVLLLSYRVGVAEGVMPERFPSFQQIRTAGDEVLDKMTGQKRGRPVSIRLPAITN
ncbi:MAG TPA: metal-dependent hydrolase, partial [Gemmatales bacterium]|nr:metal-dependent hydrolase [Gemmatales bacterium]